MFMLIRLVGIIFLLAAAPVGRSADEGFVPPAQRLSQQFAAMHSMRGDFVQKIYDEDGNLLQEASGEIAVKRPRLFYWRTTQPYEHLVVASGDTLWIYDIDLEQVSRRPFSDDLDRAPALILSGEWESLANQYAIEYVQGTSGSSGEIRYSLQPLASDNVFRSLQLVFSRDKIQSMVLIDSFSQRTEIGFSNVKYNVDIEPGLFTFSPPPGIDVIIDEP